MILWVSPRLDPLKGVCVVNNPSALSVRFDYSLTPLRKISRFILSKYLLFYGVLSQFALYYLGSPQLLPTRLLLDSPSKTRSPVFYLVHSSYFNSVSSGRTFERCTCRSEMESNKASRRSYRQGSGVLTLRLRQRREPWLRSLRTTEPSGRGYSLTLVLLELRLR